MGRTIRWEQICTLQFERGHFIRGPKVFVARGKDGRHRERLQHRGFHQAHQNSAFPGMPGERGHSKGLRDPHDKHKSEGRAGQPAEGAVRHLGCGNTQGIQRRKGRPAEISLILPAFWSYLIKDSAKIHWKNIERLREWFYERLKDAVYAKRIEAFPSAEPILEFKRKHNDLLEGELPHFFKDYEDKINPLGLQINFAKEEPKIGAFGDSKCSKEIPSIKFTNGSKFPS